MKSVDVSKNSFVADTLSHFFTKAISLSQLQALSLSQCNFGDQSVKQFLLLLKNC